MDRRGALPHDRCPPPRAAASPLALGIPRTQRPHLCHNWGETWRVVLEPGCRQSSGGAHGSAGLSPTLLRRPYGLGVLRRSRALYESTHAPWRPLRRVSRPLSPAWTGLPCVTWHTRSLADRALLPLCRRPAWSGVARGHPPCAL